MATPAQLLSDIAAAVVAQVSGIVRLDSDFRDDLESVPVGGTRFQLRGIPAGIDFDSNAQRTVEAVELLIHHRLSDPDLERAYTEGALQTDVAAMIAPSFWRNLASAFDLIEPPVAEIGPNDRDANVITVAITTQISIVP